MKWDDTIASKCRYGDVAGTIWGEADILWEDSEANYQGHATILAKMPDGRYSFYEWWYGSCGGCDQWEDDSLHDDQIADHMRKDAKWFEDRGDLNQYLEALLSEDLSGYQASRRADMELGQMLDLLGGRTPTRLQTMATAAMAQPNW